MLGLANDGVDVAVADIQSKRDALDQVVKAIEAIGRKGVAITSDVSKESEVKDMVQKVVETFGSLDIVREIWSSLGGLTGRTTKDGRERWDPHVGTST